MNISLCIYLSINQYINILSADESSYISIYIYFYISITSLSVVGGVYAVNGADHEARRVYRLPLPRPRTGRPHLGWVGQIDR